MFGFNSQSADRYTLTHIAYSYGRYSLIGTTSMAAGKICVLEDKLTVSLDTSITTPEFTIKSNGMSAELFVPPGYKMF